MEYNCIFMAYRQISNTLFYQQPPALKVEVITTEAPDCDYSIANTLELPQSCINPTIDISSS